MGGETVAGASDVTGCLLLAGVSGVTECLGFGLCAPCLCWLTLRFPLLLVGPSSRSLSLFFVGLGPVLCVCDPESCEFVSVLLAPLRIPNFLQESTLIARMT